MNITELELVKDDQTLVLTSDRNITLSLYVWKLLLPTVTVELYVKWYELYLIAPQVDGRKSIYKIGLDELDECRPDGVSAYVDHVPNPKVVKLFAQRNGFEIDELAWDLIVGRWQNDVVNAMEMDCRFCTGTGLAPTIVGTKPIACPACKGHGTHK